MKPAAPETVAEVRRTLDAPPERVFAAFTTAEGLSAWAWGPYAKDVTCEVDLSEGGAYRVATTVVATDDWPKERWAVLGRFVEVVAPRRVVYTVHWDAPVGYNAPGTVVPDEIVFVDLSPEGTGTALHMRHVGIPGDGASAEAHRKGIEGALDHLGAWVATTD